MSLAKCPNKASKSWSYSIEKLNEDRTLWLYDKLGEDLPNKEDVDALSSMLSIDQKDNKLLEDTALKTIRNYNGIASREFEGKSWVKKDSDGSNNLVESKKSLKRFNSFSPIKLKIEKNNSASYTAGREVYNIVIDYQTTYGESLAKQRMIQESVENDKEANIRLDEEGNVLPISEAKVQYELRVINALQKLQRNKFDKSKLQGWLNDLQKLGVPKEQVEFFKEAAKDGMTKDEIISSLLANYTYVVETNITESYQPMEEPDDIHEPYASSDYYRELTVPGGTNYTENEISTPLITPSIKGHAQFSTDQGIGWFRSDEQEKLNDTSNILFSYWARNIKHLTEEEIKKAQFSSEYKEEFLQFRNKPITKSSDKTRRILEIQSDLFQKGREQSELVKETGLEVVDYDEEGRPLPGPVYSDIKGNQFLQLLNKDSNWVTFFIKSIVQDSAKKGYKKVLFPKGETAAKIEGHETIANEIKKLDDDINTLNVEYNSNTGNYNIRKKSGYYSDAYKTKEFAEIGLIEKKELLNKQKQEFKSQGIEKLKPIEAFYEIKVGNILKKIDPNIRTITDEYGNQWYEYKIKFEDSNIPISLSLVGDTLDFFGINKIKNLYFDNNKIKQPKELLQTISKNTKDPVLPFVANLLLRNIDKLPKINIDVKPQGTKIGDNYKISSTTYAVYYGYNDIAINESAMDLSSVATFEKTILHELLHAFTVNSIIDPKTQEQKEFKKKIESLYNIALKNSTNKDMYGYKNSREFISELMTNPEFHSELETKPYNVFRRILNAILELFGISPRVSTTQEQSLAYDALKSIVDYINENNTFININNAFKDVTYSEAQITEEQIKAHNDVSKELSKLEAIKEKAMEKLNIRLNKQKYYGLSKENKDKAEQIILEMEKQDSALALIKFIRQANKDIGIAFKEYDQIKDGKIDIKKMFRWRNTLMAYDTLDELRSLLYENFEQKEKFESAFKEAKYTTAILNEIIERKDKLKKLYLEKGPEIVAKFLTPYYGKYEFDYRVEMKKKYNLLSDEEKAKISKEDFVERHFKIDKPNIDIRTESLLRNELKRASADITKFDRWLGALADSSDVVGSALAKVLSNAHIDARNEKFAILDKMLPVFREFISFMQSKGFKIEDDRKLYSFMLEKDSKGNYTQNIVSKHHSSFWDEYNTKRKEWAETLTSEEYEKARKEWLSINAPFNKHGFKVAKYDYISQLLKDNVITQKEYDEIESNEFLGYYGDPSTLKELYEDNLISYETYELVDTWITRNVWEFRETSDKWKKMNPQWDELQKILKNEKDPRTKFYNLLAEMSREADLMIPFNYRLNSKLPGVAKVLRERITDKQKLKESIIETVKQSLELRPEETERGVGKLTDEDGKERFFLPIHYTNKIEEKNQSYDLATIYLRYFSSVAEFKTKDKILPEIELIKELTGPGGRKVSETEPGTKIPKIRKFAKGLKDSIVTKVDSEINISNHIYDFLLMNFYGKKEKDQGKTKIKMFGLEIDNAKLINLINRYTAFNLLGANIVTGTANVLLGETMQKIELLAQEHMKIKDYHQSNIFYSRNLMGMIADIGKDKPSNIASLLIRKFDILNDEELPILKRNKRYKKLIDSNTLFFLSHAGEHYMQSRFLFGMMNTVKAYDKNGDAIKNKSDKHLSILDLYKVNKEDGNLELDERVDLEKSKWTDKDQKDFENKVRGALARMHGDYSELALAALNRGAIGRIAMMFRKFAFPGFVRRYGKHNWNNRLEMYTEGNYRTTFRFLSNIFKDIKNYKTTWYNLNTHERANVLRSAGEFLFLISIIAITTLISNISGDDDDHDNLYAFLSYQSHRLYSEILFFTSPNEALKILRSPAASLTVIENVLKAGSQMFSLNERYEAGPRKGQLKFLKNVEDLIPIYKQINRAFNMEDRLVWF